MNPLVFIMDLLGAGAWLFALFSVGLGLGYAMMLWFYTPSRMKALEQENRDLYSRLQKLRKGETEAYVDPSKVLAAAAAAKPEELEAARRLAERKTPRKKAVKEKKPAREKVAREKRPPREKVAKEKMPPREKPAKKAPAAREKKPASPAPEPAAATKPEKSAGPARKKKLGWPRKDGARKSGKKELQPALPTGASRKDKSRKSPAAKAISERARHAFPDEKVTEDSKLGVVFTEEPESVDPLIRIGGTGMAVVRALHGLGIYHFKQVTLWSESEQVAIQQELGFPHVDLEGDKWVLQARELDELKKALSSDRFTPPATVDHESSIPTHFKGDEVKVDPKIGIVFPAPPPDPDVLHLVDGIGPIMEEGLQKEGIFRLRQIALWDAGNVDEIAERIGVQPDRIHTDKWIPQARWLLKEIYSGGPEWTVANPSMSDYAKRIESFYKGEDVRSDNALGILYKSRPMNADVLTHIRGVSDDEADILNELGVWRFRQVAGWAEMNVRAMARKLGTEPMRIYQEQWIPQAVQQAELARKRDAFSGESFRVDPKLGILFYGEPDDADKLYRIESIGTDMAAVLNKKGVYTWRQIAIWDSENVREAARILDIPKERVVQEGWVRQARALQEEKEATGATA